MRTSTYKIGANETITIGASGNYVSVRESVADLIIQHPNTNETVELSQGDAVELIEFDQLYVTNTTASPITIKLTIARDKKASSAKVGGSVSIANVGGAFTQSRASVTNVNQALLAANTSRRYLLIQNNDASAVLRVTLNGTAATVAQGFRIPAGGSLELQNYVSTSAINAIMETATAAADNVEFVEG